MADREAQHWDAAYERGAEEVSWFQATPSTSLRLVGDLGLGPDDPIVDVGGGAMRSGTIGRSSTS